MRNVSECNCVFFLNLAMYYAGFNFFTIKCGSYESFHLTGLAYPGGLSFWKRRGRAHKRPSSSTRTGISKTRGGENHEKHATPPVLDIYIYV